MTPGARVAAAIDILDDWLSGTVPLDRLMAAWGRANRYAGSGDRRAIGDLVHGALRRRRSAGWMAGSGDGATGRDLMHGLHLQTGRPEKVFSGAGHAPEPLSQQEIAARRSLDGAPRAVRHDYPDWLAADYADLPPPELDLMRDRAPLYLRVNLLRGSSDEAIAGLEADGIRTEPGPLSDTALRVIDGHHRVQASRAYAGGLVEIQDAASQAVTDLAAALPGMTVLDLCAGAGGKTLGLAARMGNEGTLLAHDISPSRMAGLEERATRANARLRRIPSTDLARYHGRCDIVFVDAPCSGSGAWRRNPDAKWHLTPVRLADLQETQDRLLDQASELCRSEGAILYATCSLFESENMARIEEFVTRRPGWRCALSRSFLPSAGGDGFFAARLVQ